MLAEELTCAADDSSVMDPIDPNIISEGEGISVTDNMGTPASLGLTPVSRTADRKAVAEMPVAETPVDGEMMAETPEELREALPCAALEVAILASMEPNEMPVKDWAVMANGAVEGLELRS